MAYRVKSTDGFILEVDTVAELRSVMAWLRGDAVSPDSHDLLKQERMIPLEADMLKAFLAGLPNRQRRILKLLAESTDEEGKPRQVEDRELRQLFGLASNNALAGVMASISKHAKRANWAYTDLVVTEKHNNSSGRHVWYTVTKVLREALLMTE